MNKYTCKYCGTDLDDYLFCSFCQLAFSVHDISIDQERKSQLPGEIPMIENAEAVLKVSTTELLKETTISLYYWLRAARKAKDTFFRSHQEVQLQLAVKKISCIENILLEREGTFPKAITDSLLKKKIKKVKDFEDYLKEKNKWQLTKFSRNS